MEVKDPNQGEYREWTTKLDAPLPSIGAMVYGANLTLNGNVYQTVSKDPYPLEDLNRFMGKIVSYQIYSDTKKQTDPTQFNITKGYKFSPCMILAHSTCFHIGDGLIVTAGHSCFEGHSSRVKDEMATMKVVFGLTQLEINAGTIPAAKVFSVHRLLFGQDAQFINPVDGSKIIDRADWALLKLKPSAHGAAFPPTLPIQRLTLQDRVEKVWLAGHPWGIGLTLAKPPGNAGFCQSVGINSVEHNILTAPANSGGPIFTTDNKVIAVVASGKGDEIWNRGFLYMGGTEIVPMAIQKSFGGTRCNLFSGLFQRQGRIFIACEMPVVPAPVPPSTANKLTIQVLFGDGDDEAGWTRVTIVQDQPVPVNNIMRLTTQFSQITALSANFWQYNIRGFSFNYNYSTAAAGGRGQRGGPLVLPNVKNLIIGCVGDGDEYNTHNWVVLYKAAIGPTLIENVAQTVRVPIFLEQDWKDMDKGVMGLWDTKVKF